MPTATVRILLQFSTSLMLLLSSPWLFAQPAGEVSAASAQRSTPAAPSLLGQPALHRGFRSTALRSAPDSAVLAVADTAAADGVASTAAETVAARSGSSDLAPGFVRGEQDAIDWSYSGTWSLTNLTRASGGTLVQSNSTGDSAQFIFTGAWVSLGLIGDRLSGEVEISIDGVSQGNFDLYRRQESPIRLRFAGLSNGVHSIGLTVTGTSNPYAANAFVKLDYADSGDDSLLPDGDFEETDPRLLLSDGWISTSLAGASGGAYIRSSTGTAWFPFAGDTVTLHALANSNGGRVRMYVDAEPLDIIDLYEPGAFVSNSEPRVFSYEGFGPGHHVLQIVAYQGEATIDHITTPGIAPFIDPAAPVTGIARFEADHPALRYDGGPLTRASQDWVTTANINSTRASAGEVVYSAAAGDEIAFDFDGEWLGLGFLTDRFGGQAEIAIDGVVVDTVDLYSRYNDTLSRYFRKLGPGPHTVSINVLGVASQASSGTRVALDYFEVWDGQPLAEGAFEDDDPRVLIGRGWSRTSAADASGGTYLLTGVAFGTTAWFAFTGDSVTWQGRTRFTYQDVDVRINGASVAVKDLYAQDEGPRAFSFDGLGPGPHVLEISQVRDDAATVDVITTPAVGPADPPPVVAEIVRHEENHPAIRYNDQPYRSMPQSWTEGARVQASRKYHASSSTPGDRIQLDFSGQWVALGFRSLATSGTVEILIDGMSRGIFDTASGVNESKTFSFAGLAPGGHTVEAVVVSGTVMPDFIDVWAGQPVADGWVDAELDAAPPGLLHLSARNLWREADDEYANDDDVLLPFVNAETNAWFNFTGTGLTVLAYERDNTSIQIVIDGVEQGLFDLAPTAPFRGQPRALHFTGLGEGAHSVQVALSSSGGDGAWLDAFNVDPADTFGHTPNVEWFDTTAQETLPGTTNGGFASTVAIGDLDGDGLVELVAPGLNGRLYVYRGDGQDAGSGSPILWTSDLVGPAAEPALADLDADGDAEIVVVGREGTFAFHHDGQLFWSNPAIVSFNAAEELGWGGPTIANLDQDSEPEIVIAALDDALYVLDHLGNVTWSDPLPGPTPTVPVLADLTGDGVLDLIVAQGLTLKVINLQAGGTVAWSRELPDPIPILGNTRAFGAPAVADLDEDGRAEVIINWGHVVEALTDDGMLLWRYPTGRSDLYRPSPVTVADVTGDGQPNLVTASAILSGLVVNNHLLMVLDRAGGLVWDQNVADNSASASGVAAQDLTGNGAWEIIWNGAVDGLLLINGPDGERLYNEPWTGSGTVLDYPTLGDVDGDGQAEVVVAGANGLFVFGHTGRWVDARPLWNQHNYHINNIEGDWSVPFTEENSWELHNTYRTQTPNRDPDCVIDLDGNPVPPMFIDLSPANNARLPADAPLVISGRVLPVAVGQPLLGVDINGEPVELLDASGSFFTTIELASGANSFELRAVDRCAEAVTTLVLAGGSDATDPWADLADASVLLQARFAATTHDPATDRLLVDVQVFNDGPAVPGPVLMAVGNDVDPAVGMLVADGFTPAGEPYVVLVPDGEVLTTGSLSALRSLAFSNPQGRAIDFTPRFLAPINQPPYFTSIPDGRATVGQPWTYAIGSADGNGDAVTLRLAGAPSGMTLNGAALEWTPLAIGSFDVVIELDDGRGATARQGFVVKVEDASFNRPPLFLSAPPTQRPIGAVYNYAAEAGDLDGDALSFSLQAAPAGVTVDPVTGVVEWALTAPGQHSLALLADDGRGGQATQAWTLFVGEPATTVAGPAFASVPQTFAAIGVQYRYPWRVTTFDQSTPAVTLLQAPAGMTLDPAARTLTWVPGGGDLGSHVVELQAVDAGGQIALQRFDLEVLPVLPNQPPYLISTPAATARIGSLYAYTAQAVDPEFQPLNWSLATAPAGMAIDPDSGQVVWTPAAAQAGDADVVVQATDPDGGIASQAFQLRVRAANVAPVIDTVPPDAVTFGAFYSVRMLASDADGDAPLWRLLEGPAGMTLHPGLGWLHWTTTDAMPGSHPVLLEVTDGWGGRAELAFSIELLADTQLPQAALRMVQNPACRAAPVNVCVDASDDVGLASVTLNIAGQPRALDSSRCHLWTPVDAGQFAAIAIAVDPSGQSAQASETLTVVDCNDEQAPVVTLISPAVGSSHDVPVPIVVDVEDNTPDILTWEVSVRRKDGEEVVVLNTGSGPLMAGEVAVFDPTVLQAGDYEVDVVVSDGAQTGGIRIPLSAGSGEKAGRVAFTQQDLAWQLGAFPLVIGRSYDSLDAGPLGRDDGNFGPGWRLALSAAVEDSAADAPPGGGTFLGGEAFSEQTRITVTKPNGERVGFTFAPEERPFPAVFQFDVVFAPDAGVTDELRAIGWPDIVFRLGAGFANYLIPYNPTLYELETGEGVVYLISETDGLLEIRDPQGGIVTAEADGWQSSRGARVQYQRNAQGRISQILLLDDDGITELGRLQYGYDTSGNLISATDLAGGTRTFAYADPDLPHHVTGLFDALGRPEARMVFDDQGRQIAHCPGSADPVTLVGCSQFDFGTDVSTQTIFDGRGFRSELFFDQRGQLVLQRDEIATDVWVEQSWTYDAEGREIEHVDADGGVTLTEWDEQGNRTRKTEPDGRFWTWTWGDCSGEDEWLQQCDALGNCTQQELDAACRVLSTSDPLGGSTVFEYDVQGQQQAQIDPVGERIETEFDQRGKLQRYTDALGADVISEYGELGELLVEIERDGVRRDFAYDSGLRIVSETWSGSAVGSSGLDWSHDAANLIDGLGWAGADLDISYWPTGKIRRITHSSATAPDWWIEYSYDANNNVIRLEDSFGGITEYDYDGLNRMTEVRQFGTGVLTKRVEIDHSNSGQPLHMRRFASLDDSQPGPITDLEYTCLSCPTTLSRIAHRRPDSGLIHDLVLQRNALHQITGISDADGSHAFVFDGRGWLIAADYAAGFATADQSYVWDAAGNWLSRSGQFGGANSATLGYQTAQGGHRLLADGSNSYQYDARGGLTERSGPDGRLVIERDARGNAVSITEFDPADQLVSTASYLYSSNQQRVRAERDGIVRHYIFDGPNPIIALNAAGQVVWRQLHPRGTDRPLAMEIGGQLRWLLSDHIGSVREQVDNNGQVLASFSYDAFGRQLSGVPADLDDPVRFSGREFDLPGGLGYYRLRLYDPASARFLGADSLAPWHYRYADNNPVGLVDPSGAASALEYAFLICDDIVGNLADTGGGSEQDAVVAAFSGDVRGVLSALGGSLAGNVLPCGSASLL